MASDAERMMALFAGHPGAYGSHGVPVQNGHKWEIKSTARTLRGEVNPALWARHLAGEQPLGVIAIRQDSTCVWGSIDIDEYQDNLLGVVARAQGLGLPLVPVRSKSGGLHLFLFMREPVPAADVRNILSAWAAVLGHAGAEIFPKQTKVLTEQGDVGNWMVMPYFGGTYDGKLREQVGLRKTGAEMTLQEFLNIAEAARAKPADLVGFVNKAAQPKKNGTGPFADGPPCLQHLVAAGVGEGGRNSTLFMMGVYYKKVSPGEWKDKVENANRDYFNPPVTAEEVLGVIRSLSKEGKEYAYTCRTEPMHSHCDAKLCRLRRYGVGDGNALPTISGLSKLDTEPAIWFVDVGDERLNVSTQELMQYAKFQMICAEKLNKFYGQVKQDDWVRALGEASKNLVLVEAPGEVGDPGRFLEALEEFLVNRARATRREDLLAGLPWQDDEDGRHYFQLKELMKFLLRENWRDVTRGQVTQRIKGLGGEHRVMCIGGKTRNFWWVPGEVVVTPVRLDPPPVPGEPI